MSVRRFEREFKIVVLWRQNPLAELSKLTNPTVRKIIKLKDEKVEDVEVFNSKQINLYDCLNYFSRQEALSGSDQWYCGKCKQH